MRGFSLAEIMVAIVIMAIILIGSISVAVSTMSSFRFEHLFENLEQQFLNANALTLANVAEEKDLYFEVGQGSFWVMNSAKKDGGGDLERTLLDQLFMDAEELSFSPVTLSSVTLQQRVSGQMVSTTPSKLLIRFQGPLASLSFLDMGQGITKVGSHLSTTFSESSDDLNCAETPEDCSVTLRYTLPDSAQFREITFDALKGVSRHHF